MISLVKLEIETSINTNRFKLRGANNMAAAKSMLISFDHVEVSRRFQRTRAQDNFVGLFYYTVEENRRVQTNILNRAFLYL